MYKLVIKSKVLLDEKWVEGQFSFNDGDVVLRDNIVIRGPVGSFEETALEVGEKWARSFNYLNSVSKELSVDLNEIEAARLAMRIEEAKVAAQAVKNAEKNIEQLL